MSLSDILEGVGTVVGLGVVALCAKELIYNKYIPWATEKQKEYDIEEKTMNDDYRFSEDKK